MKKTEQTFDSDSKKSIGTYWQVMFNMTVSHIEPDPPPNDMPWIAQRQAPHSPPCQKYPWIKAHSYTRFSLMHHNNMGFLNNYGI